MSSLLSVVVVGVVNEKNDVAKEQPLVRSCIFFFPKKKKKRESLSHQTAAKKVFF